MAIGSPRLSLTRVLLLGLLAPLAAANAKSGVKVESPPAGSGDGLASEPIEKVQVYTNNATAPSVPPVDGWWNSKICSDEYCVYTNRRMAKGRGLVAVTRFEEFQKLERLEHHLNRGENRYFENPVPFTETDVAEKGPGATATKPLRRGKPLMAWSPVLIVHRAFFAQVPRKKERARLLDTAVSLLPDTTRATFDQQRARPGDTTGGLHPRSVEDILLAHPFEIDLGHERIITPDGAGDADDEHAHSRHVANYPEAAVLQHDCRPNVATYVDESFALRATVARRVQAGEELTVSYVDPFLPRAERSAWVARYRGFGSEVRTGEEEGCPCRACRPKGGLRGEEAAQQDKRMQEIVELRAELRNHDSRRVDFPMIERFLKLYEEERLHARYAEAYELAAANFNYLGDDKRAKKYADLAVQAGIIEAGPQSNDVIAMRIMASDVKGHYSYRYTLKRRGQ